MTTEILPGDILKLAAEREWEPIFTHDNSVDTYTKVFTTPNKINIFVGDKTETGGANSTAITIESPIIQTTAVRYGTLYPFITYFHNEHPHVMFNLSYVTKDDKEPQHNRFDTPPEPSHIFSNMPDNTLFIYIFFSWDVPTDTNEDKITTTVTKLDSLFENMSESHEVLS